MSGTLAALKTDDMPRTYLIRDRNGREFFKMYKPSSTKEIFKRKGWTGKIVSIMGMKAK